MNSQVAAATELQLGRKMSPEESKKLVDGLYERVLARWDERVTQGPFMQELKQGTLPMEAVRLLWKNWAYYCFEINNIIACTYQRHIGFFKRHWDLLTAFSDKVADEYIHPAPPGHVLVVMEQSNVFGVSQDEVIGCQMLAECRGILEFKRGLMYEGTMLEWWSAIATEEPIGHWARDWRQALTEKYGLQLDQTSYFRTHEEADLAEHAEGVMGHGDFNRAVLQRLLQEGEVSVRPGFTLEYSALTAVDFYGLFFDGVYRRFRERTN